MLFNSFVFAAIFLPLCLLLFWGIPSDKGRRTILLGSSLVFYGYWQPAYLILLVGLVLTAWFSALAASRTRSSWPVSLAATVLLGALAFFKYSGFLAQIAADLGISDSFTGRVPQIALPLGISFIVFQALGYVIDVHRGEFSAERRFEVVLLFKAFFPQLIAGPICRAHELIPQLKGKFSFTLRNFCGGLAIFALGLFLKEVFADGLAPQVNMLFARQDGHSQGEAWAAAVGFGAQIYADFWGYSTMAVGLAMMFGITIPVNFNLPYLASSIRDFWRRWHMTLSHWLRDYLYKPLGGSRHSNTRTVTALMLTMLLGGLWHGAHYTFIIWGGIHGCVLVLEHLHSRAISASATKEQGPISKGLNWLIGWIYTSFVVFVAWVFFRASSVEQAMSITVAMFSGDAGAVSPAILQIAALAGCLFVLQVPFEVALRALRGERVPAEGSVAAAFFLVLASVVLGAPEAIPFIYFQF